MSGYDSSEYGRHIASGLIDPRVPGGKWVHVFRDGDDVNIVTTDTQESASIARVTIGENPVLTLSMSTEGALFLAEGLGDAAGADQS